MHYNWTGLRRKNLIGVKVFLIAFMLIGCSSQPCREPLRNYQSPQLKTANDISKDHVLVYKYDGSLQCGQGAAIPVDQMKNELKDIHIFSAVKKTDGLIHLQVCGSRTGKANVYEIKSVDLEAAKKRGFQVWNFKN